MKFKPGDECICICEGWNDKGIILQGPPHPVKDGIYTVNKSHSGYVSLVETGTNTGYDETAFEKLLRKSAFDKMISGILKVPKKKKREESIITNYKAEIIFVALYGLFYLLNRF